METNIVCKFQVQLISNIRQLMKSVLGHQQFVKCNFCLSWFDTTNHDCSALTSINICEGCFERGRRGTCFRVVQPKSLSLFEVQFRRCVGTQVDTIVQGQANELLELTDRYELNNANSVCIQTLKTFLTDLVDCENDVLNRVEPMKEFINKLYKLEMARIEKVWDSVILEIDSVGSRITDYRKQVTQQLRRSNWDMKTGRQVLTEIKAQIEKSLQTYNIEKVKDLYRECQSQFYKNGFKLCQQQKQEGPLTQRLDFESRRNHNFEYLEIGGTDGATQKSKKHGRYFRTIRDKVRGLGDKENHHEELVTEPTTITNPFDPIRSPRNRMKSSNNPFGGKLRKERQRSVDSGFSAEDDLAREQTKSQILQLLKKKSPAQQQKMYPEKIMKETIYEALQRTFQGSNLLELVAYRTQHLEFQCYLEMLNWHENLQIVKFVKIGLTDEHLNLLLGFLHRSKKLSTLVITNNLLTDASVQILYSFFCVHPPIQNIYIGRNYIQPLRCKTRLHQLRDLNVNIFI